MFALFSSLLCIAFGLFLSLSNAQLTGSITSPGNPYIITITVINPSTKNIHILRWNNVFDKQLFIPPSFTVKDDQGNESPFATTYALRSGITNNDFHTLEPGQNITRIYDLRQFLQNIPSGPTRHGPKTIQIIPSTSFQGIVSSKPLNIPSEAAADLPRGHLGQYAAAGLQAISLLAAPYKVQLDFPIYRSSRQTTPNSSNGITIDTSTCISTNATALASYITDAGVYADAAHSAASDLWSPVYSQFFQAPQRATVGIAAKFAALTLRGNGPHVDAYCSDLQGLCDAEGSILGYTFTPSFIGSSYVILCPAAMKLGKPSEPCSQPFKKRTSASSSQVLFHLIMTINNAVNSVIGNNYYGVEAVLQLSNSTAVDATKNADSYAQLAVAQQTHDEGARTHSDPSCPPGNGRMPTKQKRKVPAKGAEQHLAPSKNPRDLQEDMANYTPEQALRDAQQCTGDQLTLIQNAAPNVRALAAAARDNTDANLWKQVFNGDSTVKAQVTKIFDTIAKWNTTGNDAGVKYLCDPTRHTLACKFGTTAALLGIPSTQTAYILLCPTFFYQPATLECETPSTENNYIEEIAGSILHSLISIQWLVNRDIQNGFSSTGMENDCSEWNCVTSYAQSRNLPLFDSRNYPENVAAAYLNYAFAARAALTDCSWTNYVGSMFGLQT